MTSRRRPNLTSKGPPEEVDSGRPQDVLRTFSGRSLDDLEKRSKRSIWGHLLDVRIF